jgi:hypothetical protein
VRLRSAFQLASSLLCASCVPISKLPSLASEEVEQKIDHIRDYFAQHGRLHNVAFRIRAAKKSGEHSRWRTPTIFGSGERTR